MNYRLCTVLFVTIFFLNLVGSTSALSGKPTLSELCAKTIPNGLAIVIPVAGGLTKTILANGIKQSMEKSNCKVQVVSEAKHEQAPANIPLVVIYSDDDFDFKSDYPFEIYRPLNLLATADHVLISMHHADYYYELQDVLGIIKRFPERVEWVARRNSSSKLKMSMGKLVFRATAPENQNVEISYVNPSRTPEEMVSGAPEARMTIVTAPEILDDYKKRSGKFSVVASGSDLILPTFDQEGMYWGEFSAYGLMVPKGMDLQMLSGLKEIFIELSFVSDFTKQLNAAGFHDSFCCSGDGIETMIKQEKATMLEDMRFYKVEP